MANISKEKDKGNEKEGKQMKIEFDVERNGRLPTSEEVRDIENMNQVLCERSWVDGLTPDQVRQHYGYGAETENTAVGYWKKEQAIENIKKLAEILDDKKKIRIVFDYDPDFSRAYVQIQGWKETENSPYLKLV